VIEQIDPFQKKKSRPEDDPIAAEKGRQRGNRRIAGFAPAQQVVKSNPTLQGKNPDAERDADEQTFVFHHTLSESAAGAFSRSGKKKPGPIVASIRGTPFLILGLMTFTLPRKTSHYGQAGLLTSPPCRWPSQTVSIRLSGTQRPKRFSYPSIER